MKRILVIDDDVGILAFLQKKLEIAGYTVSTAINAEVGLAKIQVELPDLVIVDVMLSGMDGLSFLIEVRSDERSRRIPLIIITARAEFADIFRSQNVAAFYAKPLNVDQIISKIQSLIGR